MLARLGRWCYNRRRVVLGGWLAAVVLLTALSNTIGGGFAADMQIPSSETEEGFDVLDEYFGGAFVGLSGTIVFEADAGVDTPAVRDAMEAFFAEVDAIDGVTVASPYEPFGGGISPDGRIAYADVQLADDIDQEESGDIGRQIAELVPDLDGVTIEIGGEALAGFEPPQSELIGLSFAIVILILATGSVLAMGLPIGVAVFGVGGGLAATVLVSNLSGGPEFATTLAAMIGLGVGIDYALFIVTRYREQLHGGAQPADAVMAALATAGRAVLFAGLTVVFSLLGLIAIGLPFVTGIGVSASTTVLVTLVASLTLLPALLGFAGHRVELTRRRGLIAAALVAVALFGVGLDIAPLLVALPLAVIVLLAGLVIAPLRTPLPQRRVRPLRETFAYRWSRFVQARPWTIAVGGAALLLALSAPLLSLRLGFSDEGNFAEDTTTRRAYDLLADGFGPGFNGPLLVTAVPTDPATAPAEIDALAGALAADPGVATVAGVLPNDPTVPTAYVLRVIPTTAPQDVATEHLVNRLRDDVIPAAVGPDGLDVAVTGFTAAGIDFSDYLAGRTPIFFAAVLVVSFLLLMAVFRSVLVPLKAVIMNLLSISAAYGVVVAVFQWGWFSTLTGVEPAPVEPFIPMMMFAIVFGLSMDYEVFLLSRVREEYDRSGDAVTSVADGLASTARVITAAAAIMAMVFGSFLLEDNRITQLFGVGLAAAIILDATLVRMLLVPATMELLGTRNWWMPAWLDRLVPRLDLEGPPPSDGPRGDVSPDRGGGRSSADPAWSGVPRPDRGGRTRRPVPTAGAPVEESGPPRTRPHEPPTRAS